MKIQKQIVTKISAVKDYPSSRISQSSVPYGAGKKVLFTVFALLLVAGLSYIVWSKFSRQSEQTISKTVSSGISGIVLLGPTCPVVKDPPDPECADKPYATNLVITTSDQARVMTEFTSDINGKFNVPLVPGEYAIRSAAAANILPYCSHDVLKVETNRFTDIIVSCDTGIR